MKRLVIVLFVSYNFTHQTNINCVWFKKYLNTSPTLYLNTLQIIFKLIIKINKKFVKYVDKWTNIIFVGLT